jgi:hypothetical protein
MAILLRTLVAWLLTLGWALLVSLGTLCLGLGNFVLAWHSFTAQGFEQLPLRHVPLLGGWAEGFGMSEAPLAALFALVLTLAMNFAIMATAKALAHALRCFFDRRQGKVGSASRSLYAVLAIRTQRSASPRDAGPHGAIVYAAQTDHRIHEPAHLPL